MSSNINIENDYTENILTEVGFISWINLINPKSNSQILPK